MNIRLFATCASLCATFLTHGRLASAQTPSAHLSPIELRIKANGEVSWNGLTMTDSAFDRRLAEAAAQTPRPRVYLLPGKLASYKQVARVVAIMQRYGVDMGLVGGERVP